MKNVTEESGGVCHSVTEEGLQEKKSSCESSAYEEKVQSELSKPVWISGHSEERGRLDLSYYCYS